MTLVEGIASGVIVSSIVEFLKGIVQQIKGKKGKVLFPKEQEKFKQAIKMSDSSELKNNPIILEISGNYNYVCIDGKYGICDKETHEEKIIPTLKKSKEQEIEQKISIMPINEAERLINYKNSRLTSPTSSLNFSTFFQRGISINVALNSSVFHNQ